MKRISYILEKRLGPIELYLDDIENLVEILGEISSDIIISSHNYEYDNVAELELNKELTINELHIESRAPSMRIRLGPLYGTIRFANDDAASRGIFEKVKEYLARRIRLSAVVSSFPVTMIAGVFAMVKGTDVFNVLFHKNGATDVLVSAWITILALIIVVLSFYAQIRQHSVIHLKRRTEFPSFLRRKKDDLILILISSVVTAFFTWVVIKWLGGK